MTKWGLVPYTRGNGVYIGPQDQEKPFPHFIWTTPEKLPLLSSQAWDFAVINAEVEVRDVWRLVKIGGYLCSATDISAAMDELETWDCLEKGEWQVYQRTDLSKNSRSFKRDRPKKTCAVVRYGAFGDMVQASSVLPWLKGQGYHITLYCQTKGHEVIQHDPHVDRIVQQDKDQVPNQDLCEFWDHLKTQYDRFINLSESVEGTLLAIPGRATHEWPHEVRRKYMNVNYLEMVHDIAGVPFPPRQAFYATPEEVKWAKRERQALGAGPVLLWTLSGSSIHKAWPYLDQIVARLMKVYPNSRVVMVGDELSQLLEQGWENEPRVLRRSGVWTIRQTLAFLPECDLIVGPETGVMNAAGLLKVPKIVTLSHSSEENLTKHWVNCVSLTPRNTACYPCHQLHLDSKYCPRDPKEGTAICQSDISAEQMWQAVKDILSPVKLMVA